MKKIKTLIIILVVITVGILGGCTSTKTEPNNENTPPANTPPDNNTPPPTIIYDDVEFMSWLTSMSSALSKKVDKIGNDYTKDLWYDLQWTAEAGEEIIDDDYKPECVAFSLSSTYEPIRGEINGYLDDLKWYFVYSQYATKNMQDYVYNGKSTYSSAMSNFDKADEYLNDANTHMIIANEMIEDLG